VRLRFIVLRDSVRRHVARLMRGALPVR